MIATCILGLQLGGSDFDLQAHIQPGGRLQSGGSDSSMEAEIATWRARLQHGSSDSWRHTLQPGCSDS